MMAVLLSVAMAGCGGQGVREGDALDLGENLGSICVPRGAIPKVFGDMDVRNASSEPVTIDAVTLAGAKGMRVLGARVVPFTNESRLVGEGWPPVYPDDLAIYEEDGRDPKGLTLAPEETVTLWTGVAAESGDGTADAVRVEYTHKGRSYYQDGVDKLIMVSGKRC